MALGHRSHGVGGCDERPAIDDLAKSLRQLGLAREWHLCSVDEGNDVGIDIGPDDLMPMRGELDGEREADLAERDDAHVHRDTTRAC